jgi:hypothetical protein
MGNVYVILVGKRRGKEPPETFHCSLQNRGPNETNLRLTGCEGVLGI